MAYEVICGCGKTFYVTHLPVTPPWHVCDACRTCPDSEPAHAPCPPPFAEAVAEALRKVPPLPPDPPDPLRIAVPRLDDEVSLRQLDWAMSVIQRQYAEWWAKVQK